MAERKFDYENVAQVYKNMQNITGDSSNPDSIAGILFNINKEYHEKVDVSEEAIFGDLGKQLVLNWDNTSSTFPNFVDNFGNWSTLIAQSAGKYSEFEQKIAASKVSNPLGVTSGGISSSYVNTSSYRAYANSNIEGYNTAVGNLNSLNAITGVDYVCTDTASLLKWHKVAGGVMFAGDVLALATIGLASSATAPAGAGTELAVSGGGAGTEIATTGGAAGSGAGATGTELATTGATSSTGAGMASEGVASATSGGATGAASININGATYSNFDQIKNAVSQGILDKAGARKAIQALYGNADGSIGHTYLASLFNFFSKGVW